MRTDGQTKNVRNDCRRNIRRRAAFFRETLMCELCRREFLRGATAVGANALFFPPPVGPAPRQSGATPLPARGEFVIRNAYVMTLDPSLGDVAGGSVHVRNGEIVAVGRDVQAPGAQVIDGDDMIVMPGLVETHWHMWNTLFRSFAGDKTEE